MRKIALVPALLVVVAAGVATYLARSGGYVVEIPESEIQSRLQAQFPIQQRRAGVLTATLSNPIVWLDGGSGRIGLDVDVGVDLGAGSASSLAESLGSRLDVEELSSGRSLQGGGRLSGALRYDPQSGRFLIDDSRIDEFSLDDLPEPYRQPLQELLTSALGRYVDGKPVYELGEDTFQESLARMFLRDVEVGEGVLRAVLGVGS